MGYFSRLIIVTLLLITPLLSGAKLTSFRKEPVKQKTKTSRSASPPMGLVYPPMKDIPRIPQVHFQLSGDLLKVRFEVFSDPSRIHAKKVLGPKEYPDQFDVVEVFISKRFQDLKNYSYYEFQLSPYNQSYQRLIEMKEGQKTTKNFRQLMSHSTVQMTEVGWIAEMEIPLQAIGLTADHHPLIGNAFVIFNIFGLRTYWSLFLPFQDPPNFQQPEFFKPLIP